MLRTSRLRRAMLFTGSIAVLVFVLGTGLVMVNYYNQEWLYGTEGFSLFAAPGQHLREEIDRSGFYWLVFAVLIGYSVYLLIREMVILRLQKKGPNQAYYALVCNHSTAFLAIYLLIPFVAAVFKLVHSGMLVAIYFSCTMPVFLMAMILIYWFFPKLGQRSLLSRFAVLRLILLSFLCSLPFLLSPFHPGPFILFFLCWALLLLVVTPLCWLYWQQKKDGLLQLKAVQADIQQLRSQINPHFLFNTLNTLYGKALQEKAGGTAATIQLLGDMMRFMLQDNQADFIEMDKELAYLRNYIELQRLRFESSVIIVIEVDLPTGHCPHQIAPMLFIPFIENAFKHGISQHERSHIKLILSCNAKSISFSLSNTLHHKKAKEPGSGIGISNTRDRLNLLYPGRHELLINETATTFDIQLNIQP